VNLTRFHDILKQFFSGAAAIHNKGVQRVTLCWYTADEPTQRDRHTTSEERL